MHRVLIFGSGDKKATLQRFARGQKYTVEVETKKHELTFEEEVLSCTGADLFQTKKSKKLSQ